MRWVVVAAALVIGSAAHAADPSFDCGRATTWAERTICGDEGLAMLDREMAAAFTASQAEVGDIGREQVVVDQRAWLARRDACRAEPDPVGCLTGQYRNRIRHLRGQPPAPRSAGAPGRGALGECRAEAADGRAVGLCLDRKLAEASAAYGDAEAAMLARLSEDPEVRDAFRESQEAFLRFRDGTCRWRSAIEAHGAHGAPDGHHGCLVDFTRARTAEIESLLR